MKGHNSFSYKALVATVLVLSGALVLLALAPMLSGRLPNLMAILLNLPVLLVVALKSKRMRPVILVWAALPIASCGLYLIASALRGTWGVWPGPLFFGLAGAVGLGIFLWAKRALPVSA